MVHPERIPGGGVSTVARKVRRHCTSGFKFLTKITDAERA